MLELLGKPLFASGLLVDHLEEQVRQQVVREYLGLAPVGRKLSKLRVRRRFVDASFPGAVSIAPASSITIISGEDDRQVVAEHRSAIEGDPGLLAYAPVRAMPPRRPVAPIGGNELGLTIRFPRQQWPFVSALVRAELDLIEAILARQREVMARFNARLPDVVRRLVAEQWPVLKGRAPSMAILGRTRTAGGG